MPRCAHCRGPGGRNTWTLWACADGGRKRVRQLCDRCDVELNALALAFLRIPGAKRALERYREGQTT